MGICRIMSQKLRWRKSLSMSGLPKSPTSRARFQVQDCTGDDDEADNGVPTGLVHDERLKPVHLVRLEQLIELGLWQFCWLLARVGMGPPKHPYSLCKLAFLIKEKPRAPIQAFHELACV